MYLPEEVILRVNKIEGDTVFMGPKYRCLRFLPSRPDRLLGFNQSGELWAVVGKIEFAKTRPLDGWVRLYGDDSATITTIENNEI